MKQIPDAAVQAFRQSFESTDNNCETYQDVRKALTAAIPYISAPCAVEVVDRAKRIANIYRNKDDEKVIASFNKETARVIDELLSCVFTKPVDVAAVQKAIEEAEQGANSDIIKELKDAIAWRKLPWEGRHKATLEILERALSAIIAFSVDTSPKNSLNLSNLLRHAFISGFEAKGGTITEAINHWPDYNPEQCQAYERVVSALSAAPTPEAR